MNHVEDKIVYLLTGKNHLSDVTIAELEAITAEQPYFSVAQLLLTQKMKAEAHPDYLQQAQKTALYFPNPLWFKKQLQLQDGEEQEQFDWNAPTDLADSDTVERVEQVENKDEAPVEDIIAPVNQEEPVLIPEENEEEIASEEEIIITDENSLNNEIPVVEAESDTLATEDQPVVDTPVMESQDDEAGEEIPNMKLAGILQQQMESFQQPVEFDTPQVLSSEPYHTIDYFAAVGIKLEEIVAENDVLVNKVKKFTDWLKQMKRIKSGAASDTSSEMERAIESIAALSIEEKEIITEAMADVFIKQGKIERAIQVYSKLSFLNPDKSAYFAGKILEIKANRKK